LAAPIRIEVADLTLAALDELDVDSLAIFVGPERPLQGLAGWADWRLCGALSRALRDGLYGGGDREALLLPSDGRVGAPRIFCFGLPAQPLAPDAFGASARAACDALARAGSRAFATALPTVAGGAARPWIQALLAHPVARQLLLGEARALHRELGGALDALGVAAAAVELAPLDEARARVPALPLGNAVVR
jgi:hypothetical protein